MISVPNLLTSYSTLACLLFLPSPPDSTSSSTRWGHYVVSLLLWELDEIKITSLPNAWHKLGDSGMVTYYCLHLLLVCFVSLTTEPERKGGGKKGGREEQKKKPEAGWRDNLAVKSTDCSYRGPRFNSQYIRRGSKLSVIQFQRIQCPFLASELQAQIWYRHTCRQGLIHIKCKNK